MKKCSKCKVEKLLSEFNVMKKSPDGLQYICRACQSKYVSKWQNERKAENQSEFPTKKKCQDCGLEKPVSQFGKRSLAKDKLMHVCLPCWRVYVKNAQSRMRQRKLDGRKIS